MRAFNVSQMSYNVCVFWSVVDSTEVTTKNQFTKNINSKSTCQNITSASRIKFGYYHDKIIFSVAKNHGGLSY